jgi:hypothetical protein
MDFGLMENDRILGVRSHEACGVQVVRLKEDIAAKRRKIHKK